MLTFVEGKGVQIGERVAVYFNLRKGGFSIKSLDDRNPDKGTVVAYSDFVTVVDADFHIKPSGLRHIMKTGHKEVYAMIRGTLVSVDAASPVGHRWGYCNPFTTGDFVDFETGEQLHAAAEVYFYDRHFSYAK